MSVPLQSEVQLSQVDEPLTTNRILVQFDNIFASLICLGNSEHFKELHLHYFAHRTDRRMTH